MQLKHLLKPTINYNLAKQSYTLSKYKYKQLETDTFKRCTKANFLIQTDNMQFNLL